jgi:hypothetical protein
MVFDSAYAGGFKGWAGCERETLVELGDTWRSKTYR